MEALSNDRRVNKWHKYNALERENYLKFLEFVKKLAIANPNKLNLGSINIPPGTQLRIPTDIVGVLQSYNLLNAQ